MNMQNGENIHDAECYVAVSKPVREAVDRLHKRFGHPSNEALCKVLRYGGATDEALQYAKNLNGFCKVESSKNLVHRAGPSQACCRFP